jgi:hypothetical protein
MVGGESVPAAASAAAGAGLRAIASAAVGAAKGPGLRALGWTAEKAAEEGGQYAVNAGLKVSAKFAAKFVIMPIAHEVQTALEEHPSVAHVQRKTHHEQIFRGHRRSVRMRRTSGNQRLAPRDGYSD